MTIWQTTNKEPWVWGLVNGLFLVKTRNSEPVVPVGSVVFLHTSKSMWPYWPGLSWTKGIKKKELNLGCITGLATVEAKGLSQDIITKEELKFFRLENYNCAGIYAVRFSNILKLKNPVPTRGFQSPFCRAAVETYDKVVELNQEAKDYMCKIMDEQEFQFQKKSIAPALEKHRDVITSLEALSDGLKRLIQHKVDKNER